MDNPEKSSFRFIEPTYTRRAIQLLQSGCTSVEVVNKLFEEGLESSKALTLVSTLMDYSVKYSKRIGLRNIGAGILLIFISGLEAIISMYFFAESFQDSIYWLMVIIGVGLIVWGLIQYLNRKPRLKQKQIRELNSMIYGAEEPEQIWECPQCKHKNLNATYKCKGCGYDLMK